MAQLVWFRNDLRLADNPALSAACAAETPVRACFTITPEQWQAHDWSPARVRLVMASASAVARELAGLGIPIHFLHARRFDDSLEQIEQLCRDQDISRVHFNEEYGVNERRRDRTLHQRLQDLGIQVHKYRDQTIVQVGEILTGKQQPYAVFTPFSRRWRAWIEEHPPRVLPLPGLRGTPLQPAAIGAIPEPFRGTMALPEAGENAAHRQLEQFLEQEVYRYGEQRDFPALQGTSQISPYLACGTLSGRQCLVAARQALATGTNPDGVWTWINELAWRDFYIHVLYHNPRISMHRAFKPETEALQWNPAGTAFAAWKSGHTGIPIVDAAMRQLNGTGWMHNRLRMITAMFLSKNLFIDWRLGEAYFMSKLVDGFLASNNGGWQWSASTGTDAAPYFRIFNPVTQSERFDPSGEFIRRWVPELATLDNRRIHNPGKGGPLPAGYPPAIVDLKASRKDAIARFQALKK